MKTDLVLRINRPGDILWEFSLGDHIDELCELSGLPLPIPYARVTERGGSPFVGQGRHHLGKRIHRATRYPPAAVEPLLRSRTDIIVAEVDRDGRRIGTYAELIKLYQT